MCRSDLNERCATIWLGRIRRCASSLPAACWLSRLLFFLWGLTGFAAGLSSQRKLSCMRMGSAGISRNPEKLPQKRLDPALGFYYSIFLYFFISSEAAVLLSFLSLSMNRKLAIIIHIYIKTQKSIQLNWSFTLAANIFIFLKEASDSLRYHLYYLLTLYV